MYSTNTTPKPMEQQKNKYTTYILVTIAYVLAAMFVLQEETTTLKDRFLIIWLWLVSMFVTWIFKSNELSGNNQNK